MRCQEKPSGGGGCRGGRGHSIWSQETWVLGLALPVRTGDALARSSCKSGPYFLVGKIKGLDKMITVSSHQDLMTASAVLAGYVASSRSCITSLGLHFLT